MIEIVKVCCEYMTNPIGIHDQNPCISYQILSNSNEKNINQSASRIVFLSPENKVIYDTGKINSDNTLNVPYRGRHLMSCERVYYKIYSWITYENNQEKVLESDGSHYFEMGILTPEEWQAAWITVPEGSFKKNPDAHKFQGLPAPYFRKIFNVASKPVKARLYITAQGLYEAGINGMEVTPDKYTPGWTDYKKHIQYQAYDVTGLIREGENAVTATVGDGWFEGYVGFFGRHLYGSQKALLAELRLEYEDGRTEIVKTDNSWEYSCGPIQADDNIMGELYDARLEGTGNWTEAEVLSLVLPGHQSPAGGELIAQTGSSVRDMIRLKPVSVSVDKDGRYIYDMGQNMVGQTEITLNEAAGTIVTLRFAEMLNSDGTIYTENLRNATQTDKYICKGRDDKYRQHFTFHGFRYVEVSGVTNKPGLDDLTGIVMYSDMDQTGHYECGNELINKLYSNILWGQRGNFLDVPTDCPQRDERLGWTGDAQVFCRTATFGTDAAGFFRRYVLNLVDAQEENGAYTDIAPRPNDQSGNPGCGSGVAAWADVGVIVPWTCYLAYGDKKLLGFAYPSMKRYIDYLKNTSNNLIRPDFGYGDWLNVQDDTPRPLIGTAYFSYVSEMMAEIAEALELPEDSKYYRDLAAQIKDAFIREYPMDKLTSQTSLVLALKMNMLPENMRAECMNKLLEKLHDRNDHLSTGFVGVSYLLPALSENKAETLAYKVFQNKTYPSWLYSVVNGATTIWERWNSYTIEKGFDDPGMNSFNHYAYGSVGEWMFRYSAGINTAWEYNAEKGASAYKKIIIKPEFDPGIKFVRASYDSIHGKIGVEMDGSRIRVIIPANTTADVYVPGGRVAEGLGSGEHIFNM